MMHSHPIVELGIQHEFLSYLATEVMVFGAAYKFYRLACSVIRSDILRVAVFHPGKKLILVYCFMKLSYAM